MEIPYSSSENTFTGDLGFTKTEEENSHFPGIATFLKKEGTIIYITELTLDQEIISASNGIS